MSVREIVELEAVLRTRGVVSALRYLNARTPHRFTGIYRYDDETLRNLFLVDRFAPHVERGEDVPMTDAYCALVGREGHSIVIADVRTHDRADVRRPGPVVAYCGALVRTRSGAPFGALCHFDYQPCEQRISDIPLLEAAAALFYDAVAAGDPRTEADPHP